jgi:hypothetical protein
MARQFFVRVQLKGVEEDDGSYEMLVEEMTARGFATTLALPKRNARLPVGSFLVPGDDAAVTAEEVLRRAQLAVKATGQAAAVMVVETSVPLQTFDLDPAPVR